MKQILVKLLLLLLQRLRRDANNFEQRNDMRYNKRIKK